MRFYSVVCFLFPLWIIHLSYVVVGEEISSNVGEDSNNIVGGDNAFLLDYPWFVRFPSSACGGVLFHTDLVLTAAHCIDGSGLNGGPAFVHVGASTQLTGRLALVSYSQKHPGYQKGGTPFTSDIAVIKLSTPLYLTPRAELNRDRNYPGFTGKPLKALGYGDERRNQKDKEDNPFILQEIAMNYIDNADCLEEYEKHNATSNLCAFAISGGPCYGDTGGPLIDNGGTVVGIHSYLVDGCVSTFPDMYTRVSTYYGWTQEMICELSSDVSLFSDCETDGILLALSRLVWGTLLGFLSMLTSTFNIGSQDITEVIDSADLGV